MSRYLALADCHICHVSDRPINLYICRYCSKLVCRKDSEHVEDGLMKTRACSECLKKIEATDTMPTILFSAKDLEMARKLLSLLDDKECYIMDCTRSKHIEEAENISEAKLASILAKLYEETSR